jgi:hypothetical protein
MASEGGMRKRGGGGAAGGAGVSTMYADAVEAVDDEEDKPLVGGAPLPAPAEDAAAGETTLPHHRAASAASAPGTVSKATFKVGMVVEKLREMDMADVYRYWSVFQTWLADVPAKLGTSCPPLAGLGLTRPPELTLEQLEKLDRWCEDSVGVPCNAEDHGDLLRKLWDVSFPGSDVKPDIPDPYCPESHALRSRALACRRACTASHDQAAAAGNGSGWGSRATTRSQTSALLACSRCTCSSILPRPTRTSTGRQ